MRDETRHAIGYYTKVWLGRSSLILMALLMVPTLAIATTWNTLPGERLYPVKTYLEKMALLLVGDNFGARADLQTQIVHRRFSESQTLIASANPNNLTDFTKQVATTKTEIVKARSQVGTKVEVTAQIKAEKFTTQLKEYDKKLEETKVELQKTVIEKPKETEKPMETEKPVETEKPKVVEDSELIVPVETKLEISVNQQQVAEQIAEVEQAQAEIKTAIEELEQVGYDNEVTSEETKEDSTDNEKNNNRKSERER